MKTINFLQNFEQGCINKELKSIRFVKSFSRNGSRQTVGYGYFELDDVGKIIECERGHSQYKGLILTERQEAQEKYPMTSPFDRHTTI